MQQKYQVELLTAHLRIELHANVKAELSFIGQGNFTSVKVDSLWIRFFEDHDWIDVLPERVELDSVHPETFDLDEWSEMKLKPWVQSIVADCIGPLHGFCQQSCTSPRYASLLEQIEAAKKAMEAEAEDVEEDDDDSEDDDDVFWW